MSKQKHQRKVNNKRGGSCDNDSDELNSITWLFPYLSCTCIQNYKMIIGGENDLMLLIYEMVPLPKIFKCVKRVMNMMWREIVVQQKINRYTFGAKEYNIQMTLCSNEFNKYFSDYKF